MASHLLLLLCTILPTINGGSATGMVIKKGQEGLDLASQAFSAVELFVDAIGNDEANGTKVTIGINSQDKETWDYEGSVGIVWAFDVYNNVLGSSDVKPGGRKGDGEAIEVYVHQYGQEEVQAIYIDVITSDDEICISYIFSQTYRNTKQPFGWTGDIGKACGQAWEHGGALVTGGGDKVYAPACVWLDQDHGDDIDVKGANTSITGITNRQMKINIYAHSGSGDEGFQHGETIDTNYVCGATVLTWDMGDPLTGITPRGPYMHATERRMISDQERMQSRAVNEPGLVKPLVARPQSQSMAERLWVNSRPDQSAIELCNSPTSRGSDFVSADEGLFCDMDTKTLYPVCTAGEKMGCFDLDTDALQLRKRDHLRKRASIKQYKKITHVDWKHSAIEEEGL